MKIFTWISDFFNFFFLCVRADIRSTLFGRKILNEFLRLANQDKIFGALLKEAKARRLRLIPLPGILEVFNVGMAVIDKRKSKKIAISVKLMKGVLKKGGMGRLNFHHLSFAHELGHFDQIDQRDYLAKERQKTCNIKKDCFYVELLASKRGLQIIRKITAKRVSKKLIGELVATSLVQCHRYGCLDFIKKDASACPKIKEIKEMVGLVFRENKISFLPSKNF